MEMTQFQRNLIRMLDGVRKNHKGESRCAGVNCNVCPLFDCCYSNYGNTLLYAEKIIEIVKQWSKEHPIVTYEQKYEEVFGVEPKNERGEYVCPAWVGFDICDKDAICSKGCNENFWTSEYKEPKREGE